MTPVDTLYEYAGYKLAGALHELLSGAGLPLILGLAGAAYVVKSMAERGSPRDLAVYLVYLILAWWLVSPTRTQEVAAPRFVVYLGQATDLLQKRAVSRIQDRFLDHPFEWERLAAMASFARILDPALALHADEFLEACAKPALARASPAAANLFRPGVLPYGDLCERRRQELWGRLQEHVRTDRFHRAALELARLHDPAGAAGFHERYLDEIAARTVDDPGSPTSEMELVFDAVGAYSLTDPAQSSAELPWWARWLGGDVGATIFNFFVSGAAGLEQWWTNATTVKQKYYLISVYGPHVYGLALLLALGLFPIAGLFALFPGKWRAFLNFGKLFLSIKLWPVCWAALSIFNARRSALEVFNPTSYDASDVFLAVVSMYFLTPLFAFLIVHLAATAMAAPFSPALPPPAGPGLGPAGPAANLAVRLGR